MYPKWRALVNGTTDYNLQSFGGLILTHTHITRIGKTTRGTQHVRPPYFALGLPFDSKGLPQRQISRNARASTNPSFGCGSKPCTPGEHQNRWYIGADPWPFCTRNGAVKVGTAATASGSPERLHPQCLQTPWPMGASLQSSVSFELSFKYNPKWPETFNMSGGSRPAIELPSDGQPTPNEKKPVIHSQQIHSPVDWATQATL